MRPQIKGAYHSAKILCKLGNSPQALGFQSPCPRSPKTAKTRIRATKTHQNPPPRALGKPVGLGGSWWVLVGKCPRKGKKPLQFILAIHQLGTNRKDFVPKWNGPLFRPIRE